MFSFVHEVGDKEEDAGYPDDHTGPYEHTHVFAWWKNNLDVTNARAFDLKQQGTGLVLHPNIANKRGLLWAKTICMKYHKGFKTKADGKKYFIAPIFLHQIGVETWEWEADMYEVALSDPTLIDACLALDIVPKSISDINMIRKQGKARDFSTPEATCHPQLLKPRSDLTDAGWDPVGHVFILKGLGGRGKTNWALSQSLTGKTHLITTLDDLKKVRPDCDLLVFDELKFGEGRHKQEKCGMVALTDMKYPRTIWARNTNVQVPAVRRIFCVNEHESVFGDDPALGAHLSITRRVFEWDIDDKWGHCYFDRETQDGLVIPVIPSNGPFEAETQAGKRRKREDDEIQHDIDSCTNPNCHHSACVAKHLKL